jgi:hypothetical protein
VDRLIPSNFAAVDRLRPAACLLAMTGEMIRIVTLRTIQTIQQTPFSLSRRKPGSISAVGTGFRR